MATSGVSSMRMYGGGGGDAESDVDAASGPTRCVYSQPSPHPDSRQREHGCFLSHLTLRRWQRLQDRQARRRVLRGMSVDDTSSLALAGLGAAREHASLAALHRVHGVARSQRSLSERHRVQGLSCISPAVNGRILSAKIKHVGRRMRCV